MSSNAAALSVINAPKKQIPKSISIPCAPFAAKHCPLPDPAQFMPLPTGHGSIQPLDASAESAMPDSCPRDECPHPCHAAVAHHHRIHPAVKIPSLTATAKIPNAIETTIMPTSIPCRHRSQFTITGSMSPPSCGLAEAHSFCLGD